MPYYDLLCKTCETEHNIRATIAEKTEKRIPCPDCGSLDMETLFKTPPAVIKGRGAGKNATPCLQRNDSCVSCPHAG
jgi:putative FmdB family regulatory protein